ncbi:MAG: hypothetical protein EOP67_75495 [Sphingomonas sp.]|nr:MAG: hypothetical protein EOP67_75495 [Sphingomonas sp.]
MFVIDHVTVEALASIEPPITGEGRLDPVALWGAGTLDGRRDRWLDRCEDLYRDVVGCELGQRA